MTVKNEQLVIDAKGAWNPRDVVFITAINWIGAGNGRVELNVLLKPEAVNGQSKGWFSAVLAFTGIRDLETKSFGHGPLPVAGFDIIDIRDRNIEGANYLVEDYEDNVISFHCHSASIESITPHEGDVE